MEKLQLLLITDFHLQKVSKALEVALRQLQTELILLALPSQDSRFTDCLQRANLRFLITLNQTHFQCPRADIIYRDLITDNPNYDWLSLLSEMLLEYQQKSSSPFVDQLASYTQREVDRWHTPGHMGEMLASGHSTSKHINDLVGTDILAFDLSASVHELDSLAQPNRVLRQSMQLAAQTYGCQHSYFCTTGTSLANKIVILSLLQAGQKVLVERSCHKSVHHAAALACAKTVYLDNQVNPSLGLYLPIEQKYLLKQISQHANAKLLVLTSCSYDGIRYKLAPIINHCHSLGIKVFIDEAWYAHACFHPNLRPTALEQGADYVTHSTHKTMNALSQGSMIHINDPDFHPERFQEFFNMFSSTSPNYIILASLDGARQLFFTSGYQFLSQALKITYFLRKKINAIDGFKVLSLKDFIGELGCENYSFDPTKLTIDCRQSGLQGYELELILVNRYNIQVEKANNAIMTLLISAATTLEQAKRLIRALNDISQSRPLAPEKGSREFLAPKLPAFGKQVLSYRKALYAPFRKEFLFVKGEINPQLENTIAANEIVPYPPGIPLVLPGQRLNLDILQYLQYSVKNQSHIEIHGLVQQGDNYLLTLLDKQK